MMAASKTFVLELISPSMSREVDVNWVHIQSTTGSFLVGPDHRPLVAVLKPKGELRYRTSGGEEQTLNIVGGLVRVIGDRALVILDK